MTIPTKDNWGKIDKNDLDAKWACKEFLGKSTSQARKMFLDNSLYYQEALLSMPPIPFNYYAPVFADYLLSDAAQDDSDGASSYLHMIVEMLTAFETLPSPEVKQKLLRTAKMVSEKQDFYDADPDIYGDFPSLFEEILRLNSAVI